MQLFLEIFKFMLLLGLIIVISKYILVVTLRKLAENLNLKPHTVGEIAGYATSVPELLTISISSMGGLIGASVYNIISSNIINLVQYLFTIFFNKNYNKLKNKAIIVDIVFVLLTIIIPLVMLLVKIKLNLFVIPGFVILYALFRFLNKNVHKLYLKEIDKKLEKEIEDEEKWERGNRRKTIKYIVYLIIVGLLLFFIGNILSNVLENLANKFGISQFIIGVLLGFATSVPELITFFESQKHHKKEENSMMGIVEATNNLLTSNLLNLFIIQTIGIILMEIFV